MKRSVLHLCLRQMAAPFDVQGKMPPLKGGILRPKIGFPGVSGSFITRLIVYFAENQRFMMLTAR